LLAPDGYAPHGKLAEARMSKSGTSRPSCSERWQLTWRSVDASDTGLWKPGCQGAGSHLDRADLGMPW